jgi:hypothetical protein
MVVAEAGEDEGLSRLERVVESHLKRFAFREPGLAVDWRRAGQAPANPPSAGARLVSPSASRPGRYSGGPSGGR